MNNPETIALCAILLLAFALSLIASLAGTIRDLEEDADAYKRIIDNLNNEIERMRNTDTHA